MDEKLTNMILRPKFIRRAVIRLTVSLDLSVETRDLTVLILYPGVL